MIHLRDTSWGFPDCLGNQGHHLSDAQALVWKINVKRNPNYFLLENSIKDIQFQRIDRNYKKKT